VPTTLGYNLLSDLEPSTDTPNLNSMFESMNLNECLSSEYKLQTLLREAFDNPNDYDLRIIVNNKPIYCHKAILKLRNKKFWQNYGQSIDNEDDDEITVDSFSHKSFHAFAKYLYANVPEVNDENLDELLKLADIYDEPDLKRLCSKLMTKRVRLENICFLYEMAIHSKLDELEKSCIEFAVNNWKHILSTEEFQTMSYTISKGLMQSALQNAN